jgi:hypothetical protein
MSNKYLKRESVDVLFDNIFLDPNNPRIAPEEPPGYDEPDKITGKPIQEGLEEAVRVAYKVEALMGAIQREGWLPLDPIIIWELPNAKGKYVVIEGNTRVTVLRMLRARLDAEKETLERASRAKKGHTPEAVQTLREQITHLEKIKADTLKIQAWEVDAATSAQLEDILPHLHSVRHINHAKQWSPYATNLYLLDEYRKLHRKKYPNKPLTKLDDDLVKQVANLVSLSRVTARRNLQSAAAYSNFKLRYVSRLPADDEFSDRDHYFFSIIMEKPFLREQFGIGENDLQLDPEKEEVLFKWAFSKSRKDVNEDNEDEKNPNILHKAEALRDWDKIKKYDDDHKTGFHRRLDVENPDEAVSMRRIEIAYLAHQARIRPIEPLPDILEAIRGLKAEDLISNGTALTPILEEVIKVSMQYLRMIQAAASR